MKHPGFADQNDETTRSSPPLILSVFGLQKKCQFYESRSEERN